ncbi:unnamed protein product, partial [Oikopleura dioica]
RIARSDRQSHRQELYRYWLLVL